MLALPTVILSLAIFLRGNDGFIKITDFGLAVHTDGRSTDKEVNRRRGTPGFRAPEMYEDEPIHNLKALDIYALGVTLWQLLGGLRNPRLFNRANIGLEGLEEALVYNLTHPDPDARPTIAEVLADKWLATDDGGDDDPATAAGEDAANEWWQNASTHSQHPFSLIPMLWPDMQVSWA